MQGQPQADPWADYRDARFRERPLPVVFKDLPAHGWEPVSDVTFIRAFGTTLWWTSTLWPDKAFRVEAFGDVADQAAGNRGLLARVAEAANIEAEGGRIAFDMPDADDILACACFPSSFSSSSSFLSALDPVHAGRPAGACAPSRPSCSRRGPSTR